MFSITKNCWYQEIQWYFYYNKTLQTVRKR